MKHLSANPSFRAIGFWRSLTIMLVFLLPGLLPSGALANSITIGIGGGNITVAETAGKPIRRTDPQGNTVTTYPHAVNVKNTSPAFDFTTPITVTKTIAAAAGAVTGFNPAKVTVTPNPDGTTTITYTLPKLNAKTAAPPYSYTTANSDLTDPPTAADNVKITFGGTSSTDTPIETQDGAKGTGGGSRLPGSGKFQAAAIHTFGGVTYDATTSLLSFTNEFVVAPSILGDPILGAAVDLPEFRLEGFTPDGSQALFSNATDESFRIHQGLDVYLNAGMDFLIYDMKDNSFSGDQFFLSLAGVDPSSPFYDPSLPNVNSPFLQAMDSFLNPASAQYDPFAFQLYLAIPEVNFAALSANFTVSAGASIIDLEGLSTTAVPEPSTLILIVSGLVAAARHRRKDVYR